MNRFQVKPLNIGLVALIAAILFIPFGGQVPLFDWDEINFAESAREMIVTGNFTQVTINYEPFWEKPPLFIWLQALSMKVFGVNEFAARFPNALAGIATLCLLFFIGTRYYRGLVGEGWVLAYAGSLFPHFYFNTGLIDPLFNMFIFLGLFQVYIGIQNQSKSSYFWIAGLFTGLAILTKGPVALLVSILVLVIFSIFRRNLFLISVKNWFIYLFVAFIVSSFWFLPEMIVNGPWFIKEFFQYQIELASQNVAGHAQPFYYHFVVLLIGCFPASIIAFSVYRKKISLEKQEKDLSLIMMILFFVVLILFSLVKTKIVHYSSLCWIPLSFMAGLSYNSIFRERIKIKTWQKIILGLISIIWLLLFSVLPAIGFFSNLKDIITPLIKDEFVLANINLNVAWSGWEFIPVFVLIFGLIFSLIHFLKKNDFKGVRTLFLTNILFVPLYSIVVIPKAEKHIQGSVIDFYKSIAGKDVYVKSTEKSYAPYFYAQVKPLTSSDGWYIEKNNFVDSISYNKIRLSKLEREQLESYHLDWLMNGKIDKTVYLVCKTHKADFIIAHPYFKLIENKGGYSFFKREIPSQ